MTPVTVDWLPAIGAGVVAFMLGGLWYGPLFGRRWMTAHGLPDDYRVAPATYGVGIVSYVLMAVAFSALASVVGVATIGGGLVLALALWAGFVLQAGLNSSLFAARPGAIFAIDATYQLASLLIIGAVLGAAAPGGA